MTGEQLAWFLGDKLTGSEAMKVVINQLERLHVTLQVVVALRTYLSVPLASLTHFTDQVRPIVSQWYWF